MDKPADWTSHDVVAKIRTVLKTKKAGHAGTLDPQATGLVVVAVGAATRWLDWLQSDKSYRASLILGKETNTQDIWGEVIAEKDISGISADDLAEAVKKIEKMTEQVPPMFSALKKDGKKLYELAREGKVIERPARPIKIWDLKVLNVALPGAEFELTCGTGTYIRTVCHDLGQALGTGACLSALRRTASGLFNIEQAMSLEEIERLAAADPAALQRKMITADVALAHLPFRNLDEKEACSVDQGRSLVMDKETAEGVRYRLRRVDGSLAALGITRTREGRVELHPDKVFHDH